jgi:hypothetical protein
MDSWTVNFNLRLIFDNLISESEFHHILGTSTLPGISLVGSCQLSGPSLQNWAKEFQKTLNPKNSKFFTIGAKKYTKNFFDSKIFNF